MRKFFYIYIISISSNAFAIDPYTLEVLYAASRNEIFSNYSRGDMYDLSKEALLLDILRKIEMLFTYLTLVNTTVTSIKSDTCKIKNSYKKFSNHPIKDKVTSLLNTIKFLENFTHVKIVSIFSIINKLSDHYNHRFTEDQLCLKTIMIKLQKEISKTNHTISQLKTASLGLEKINQ